MGQGLYYDIEPDECDPNYNPERERMLDWHNIDISEYLRLSPREQRDLWWRYRRFSKEK